MNDAQHCIIPGDEKFEKYKKYFDVIFDQMFDKECEYEILKIYRQQTTNSFIARVGVGRIRKSPAFICNVEIGYADLHIFGEQAS